MRVSLLLLCLFLAAFTRGQSGYVVTGKLNLDTSIWAPTIYLSILESFDDRTAISPGMIIDADSLDSEGTFTLKGSYLPEGNMMYRLHIVKQGDPVSTIIIGGREHNHCHFAMRPGDSVDVSAAGMALREIQLEGNASNDCITAAETFMRQMRTRTSPSGVHLKFKDEEAAAELVELAFDCDRPLGILYTAYMVLERYDKTAEANRLAEILKSSELENSPYYAEVSNLASIKLDIPDELPDTRANLLGILLVVPIAFGVGWWITRREPFEESDETPSDRVDALSVQERKVLELLSLGKSNKEISAELNIGVNTVKSHVQRVYRKLNIHSRKEAYQLLQQERQSAV